MRIRRVSRATLPLLFPLLFLCAFAGAQTIDPFYSGSYSLTNVAIAGVPTHYGGLIFKAGAPNTLIIGGAAAEASGRFYEVPVVRGAGNHVVAFGTPVLRGFGAYNDGGIAYGPGGVLFYSQYGPNAVAQVKPGSNADDKLVALGPLGIADSTGALNFVPAGYNGAGQLKVSSWDGGEFYTVTLTADGSGTYNLAGATQVATLGGGPEGFAYVPLGSPLFGSQSMLVSEYSAGNVAAYTIDANGNPVPGSRRTFIAGLDGAEGAAIDPLTGDFLFSTCGCGGAANRVIAVRGFTLPGTVPPNYQGLWWADPPGSQSGWGINFAHQGDIIFATWFTYDAEGKPTWFAAELHKTAEGVYTGDVITVSGVPFDSLPWSGVTETTIGTMTVSFSDATHASMDYTVNGISQTKAITLQTFAAPVPSCVFGVQSNLSLAANYQDLWWAAPAGSESGWGVNFTHQGGIIFFTWFTYDANGKATWFIAVAQKTAEGVYAGPISTVTGNPFNAVPWDLSKQVETEVGATTITFADGNHATFSYTINGETQVKQIVRQVFVDPGTVCQ